MDNVFQNPVVLKVHNGTLRGGSNLCLTCRYAHHSQSALSGKERILCTAMSPAMPLNEPVARCSSYLDRSRPSLIDMQEIAWSLQTDKVGRSIGFLSPDDLRRRGEGWSQPPTAPGFGA